HQVDMSALERGLAKAGRIKDLFPTGRAAEIRRHIEEGVKGAAGRGANNSRDRRQSATNQLAPRLEFAPHPFDTILVPFKCRQRGVLADTRGIARLLTLNVGHGLDYGGRTDSPSHPPTGHRVALTHPADRDSLLRQTRPERGEASRARILVDETLVNLVTQDAY